MRRGRCFGCSWLAAVLLWSAATAAQPELVARGVAEARRTGDEAALVHLADEIGPTGVAECLEHANRSGRLICAEAARFVDQEWPTLSVLAGALGDHDRQVASRAAESMASIVLALQPGDLGPQEPLPDEAEALLETLRGVAADRRISLDIRTQAVTISGAFARLVGARLEVPRRALDDPELAVRRAAVGALMGSQEPDDITSLAAVVSGDRDLMLVAHAAASVCEVTLGAGVPLPAPVEERVRTLLEDERARPSQIRPLLTCLARTQHERATPLQRLAERHPNEGSRRVWAELTREEER